MSSFKALLTTCFILFSFGVLAQVNPPQPDTLKTNGLKMILIAAVYITIQQVIH